MDDHGEKGSYKNRTNAFSLFFSSIWIPRNLKKVISIYCNTSVGNTVYPKGPLRSFGPFLYDPFKSEWNDKSELG